MKPSLTSPQPEKIKEMFSLVAKNYDKANSVLSLGIHHLWRKKLVQLSLAKPGQSVLDCATGTGDLAIAFKQVVGVEGKVIGTDFCENMMLSAPEKARKQNLEIHFEKADVTQLQFPKHQFDITSISFGIRNVSDPLLALKEMSRVTRPGGRVMVLEFGQMNIPLIANVYQYYSEKILPIIGGWVTGQKAAYEYLQKSSSQFPCRTEFTQMMESTKLFSECSYFSLSGGIAYIYVGINQKS